jgi:hypothetical protein
MAWKAANDREWGEPRIGPQSPRRTDLNSPEPERLPKPGLNAETKAEARRRYEGAEPLASIARSLNCHRTSLVRLRNAEGWVVSASVLEVAQVGANVTRRAQAQVIDMATRQVVEQAVESGVVEQTANDLQQSLESHARLSSNLLAFAESVLADARAGNYELPKGQTIAQYANEVAELIAKAIAISRDVAGKRPGQASASQNADSNEPIRIEQRRLEPVKIAVDERGRLLTDTG